MLRWSHNTTAAEAWTRETEKEEKEIIVRVGTYWYHNITKQFWYSCTINLYLMRNPDRFKHGRTIWQSLSLKSSRNFYDSVVKIIIRMVMGIKQEIDNCDAWIQYHKLLFSPYGCIAVKHKVNMLPYHMWPLDVSATSTLTTVTFYFDYSVLLNLWMLCTEYLHLLV